MLRKGVGTQWRTSIVILLNEHVVKLSPKYLCLFPKTNAIFSLKQTSSHFSKVNRQGKESYLAKATSFF